MTTEEANKKQIIKSERDIQNQIANYLRLNGVWFDQDAMHKRRTGTAGTPDFLFPYKGMFCAVEVKHGAGKLRIGQSLALSEIRLNGGRCAVVRSLEEFVAFLREVEN